MVVDGCENRTVHGAQPRTIAGVRCGRRHTAPCRPGADRPAAQQLLRGVRAVLVAHDPAQPGGLTLTQPTSRDQSPHRGQPVVGDGGEERRHLLRGPYRDGVAVPGASPFLHAVVGPQLAWGRRGEGRDDARRRPAAFRRGDVPDEKPSPSESQPVPPSPSPVPSKATPSTGTATPTRRRAAPGRARGQPEPVVPPATGQPRPGRSTRPAGAGIPVTAVYFGGGATRQVTAADRLPEASTATIEASPRSLTK